MALRIFVRFVDTLSNSRPPHAGLNLQPNFPKPLLPPMNKSTLHEMFGCETKIQIPRSIWFPVHLRWALVLAVLIVPQAGRALEWHATVGAQSGDKGHLGSSVSSQ